MTPQSTTCGELVCPRGSVCSDAFTSCFTEDRVSACEGAATGDGCTTGGIASGVCDRGVCFATSCGDGFVASFEACDDGNHDSGDGCSPDCDSIEICGNAVLDTVNAEQCDCGDGTVPLALGCNNSNSDAPGSICRPDCRYHCGDGEINAAEQCEPGLFSNATCVSLGFDRGALDCAEVCQWTFDSCGTIGWTANAFLDSGPGGTNLQLLGPDSGFQHDANRIYQLVDGQWVTVFQGATHNLRGLHANSETEVYAVTGDSFFVPPVSVSLVGEIYVSDGQTWERIRQGGYHSSIYASAPNDIYVAISSLTGARIEHFDGNNWTAVPGGLATVNRLWASSPSDVWGVGSQTGGGLVLRGNADGFTDVGPELSIALRAVAGSGPDDVWVGGAGGEVHHWTDQWEQVSSVPAAVEHLIRGTDEVWASTANAIYHYDGTAWLRVYSDCVGALAWMEQPWLACNGATWLAGDWMWLDAGGAVGEELVATGRDEVYVTEANTTWHFDGDTWEEVELLPGVFVRELEMGADGKLYAGGLSAGLAVLEQTGWEATGAGLPGGYFVRDIWVSATGEFYVARGPVIGGFSRVDWTTSGEWQAFTSTPGSNTSWLAVAGSSDTNVYALGNLDGSARIIHYDGTEWTLIREIDATMNDIWVAGDGTVFAVGTGGTVQRFDGSQWSVEEVPTALNLVSVRGRSSSDVFVAANSGGEIWHFDGTRWTEIRGQSGGYSDIAFVADSVLFGRSNGIDWLWQR